MPTSYPLTAPAQPVPARISLRPGFATGIAVSPFTGHQQVYKYPAQGWIMDVSLPPMRRADADEWLGFFLALNGRYGTFSMGDPTGRTPRGIATGTPVVKGAGQSGQSLLTDGWTISQTGILKRGDYIQIANGLYRLMHDTNSDVDGNATLDIYPRLRATPADNATIITSNTVGLWRLSRDENNIDISPGPFYEIGFTAVESF